MSCFVESSGQLEMVETEGETLEIKGLETYTNYSVTVSAFTRAGKGKKSAQVFCQTAETGKLKKVSFTPKLLIWIAIFQPTLRQTWRVGNNRSRAEEKGIKCRFITANETFSLESNTFVRWESPSLPPSQSTKVGLARFLFLLGGRKKAIEQLRNWTHIDPDKKFPPFPSHLFFLPSISPSASNSQLSHIFFRLAS